MTNRVAPLNLAASASKIRLTIGVQDLTNIDGDLLWHAVAADRLGQETRGSLLVALLRQQKINGLTVFIHGAVEIPPLAFDFDKRLIHPPAHPHRALAAMEGLFQLGTVFQDPTVDRGVIDRDTAFLHQLFHLAVAQGVGHVPPHTREDNIFHKVDPLNLTMISLPLITLSHRGRSYPTELVNENLRQIPFIQVVVREGGGSSHARGKARRGRGSNSAKDTVPPCFYASNFPCKLKLNQA
jgi:hypothetical protein